VTSVQLTRRGARAVTSVQLTRRYRFPAAHVLANPSFPAQRNQELYGKCANPAGHGHDYGIEVTVEGPVDPRSGRVVEPERLDAIVRARVLERFSHRLLNRDPLFRDRVPTAENIACSIHQELAEPLSRETGVRVVRVRVQETRRNSFVYGDME
jgi:6-pyruvoyltetrahydropterin/6-carboxytetrahydropterin synthase